MYEKDESKYYFPLIRINLGISIIPHLLIKSLWLKDIDSSATSFELIYTTLCLPILLLISNYTPMAQASRLCRLFCSPLGGLAKQVIKD
jgi:hypothetical protein